MKVKVKAVVSGTSRPMKDSGVEWLGAIPKNWEVRKVKHYYTLQTGFTPDTKNEAYYDEDGFDWVNISDIIDGKTIANTKNKISQLYVEQFSPEPIPEGSLMYSFKLSVGQTAFAGKELYSNEAIASFLPSPKISLSFLRYSSFMIIENAEVNIYNARILNRDRINNAYIVFPPLTEQKRIAAYLDKECARIDSVIEKTRESIEEYKKLKQSIITEAVTKGIRPNRELKKSGIEWLDTIPADWDVKSIGRLFTFIGGYAFPSEIFCKQTRHQVVRMGNIKDNRLLLEEKAVFIDEDYAQKVKPYIIKPDDILFTMTGTKGKKDYFYTALVNDKDTQSVNMYINQRVGCFRKNIECDMRYYNYLLKVPELKDYIFMFETGTANQGNLGIASIQKTRLYSPSLQEQIEIADYLDMQCEIIDLVIRKKDILVKTMTLYKQSLIYECVTGKREVLV